MNDAADNVPGAPVSIGSTGIGTAVRDLATGERQWDATLKSIFGLPPGAPAPTHDEYLRLVVAGDRDRVDTEQQRLGAAEPFLETSYRIRTPHGELRHILARSAVQFDDHGRPRRVLTAAIDQTAARRADEALREAHERLRLATEASGIGCWERDLATGAGRWDAQMFRLHGLPPADAAPPRERIVAAIHPDDRAAAEQAWQQLLAGHDCEYECRVARPDGTTLQVILRGRVLRDGNGRPLRAIGTIFDVTDIRRTQRERDELAARMALVSESLGLGVWDWDLPGRRSVWNDQMYALFGRSRGDLRNADWLQAVHADDRAGVETALRAVLAAGPTFDVEYRVVRPDGTVRWIASRGRIERDAGGAPLRMLGVNWDVTDRRRAEDALREKTAAVRASRAKSDFLSRVSHELRTPLNAILGFAQILTLDRSAPLAPVQLERLRQIETAGRHLLALIDDVLDLSRIEAGAERLTVEPIELPPVIETCLAMTAAQATAQGVRLRALPGEQPPPRVLADATRLKQVLLNLLSNAVKYNRRGGDVEVRVEAPPAGPVAIHVTDTGFGMDAGQAAQLFQPFNRLGRESQPIPGAGLGLAISQRLVEQMGGSLSVRSQAGTGSEFTVSLRRSGSGAESTAAAPAAVASAPRQGASGGRVLYVEDVASNRALVAAFIAHCPGVELLVAADGAAALRLAATERLDLALIDIGLPDMPGIELPTRLRRLPHLRDLRCIAVSANALAHDIERAVEAGFDDYWTKPLQADRFMRGLDDLLRRATPRT